MDKLNVKKVDSREEIPWKLLELADPSTNNIEKYLVSGTCYVARINCDIIGVIVLDELNTSVIEVKNISIKDSFQRKGYGKFLLRYAEKVSKQLGYYKLKIGTGNSSIGQLALYQKLGFEILRIDKNFFIQNYKQPIFENGIQCKHMIILEKEL